MKLFFIIAGKTVFGQMVTGQMSLTGMEQVNSHPKLPAKIQPVKRSIPVIFLKIQSLLIFHRLKF